MAGESYLKVRAMETHPAGEQLDAPTPGANTERRPAAKNKRNTRRTQLVSSEEVEVSGLRRRGQDSQRRPTLARRTLDAPMEKVRSYLGTV